MAQFEVTIRPKNQPDAKPVTVLVNGAPSTQEEAEAHVKATSGNRVDVVPKTPVATASPAAPVVEPAKPADTHPAT